MSKPHHPLRDAKIAVYKIMDGDACEEGREFLAFFTDRSLHIYFPASSSREARNRAVDWRNRAVEANEAAYLARLDGLEAARAKRGKKGKAA